MVNWVMNRNIWLLKIHTLLNGALFVLPVLVPYFKEGIGLDYNQFMLCQAIFSASIIIMEMPTGMIADLWTRRQTMIAATVTYALGQVLLYLADGFFQAAGAEIMMGIGVSLLSGTRSALLYDSLLAAGQEGRYMKEQGFLHGLGLYTLAASSALGGLMYAWNIDLPVILGAVTSFLAIGAALFLQEPAWHRETVRKHPLADLIETTKFALHGHAEIAGIILLSAVLFAVTKTLLWSQQPYYIYLGLPVTWFGIMTAAGNLLGGAAGQAAHMVGRRFSNLRVLYGCLILLLTACVICGAFPGYHAVGLLLLGSMVWGYGFPRVQDAINKRVPSARRATILSTANLMVHVFSVPLLALIGLVTEREGIATSLLVLAGIMGTGGLIARILIKNRGQQTIGQEG